jgi:hypothetical protein
LRIFILLIEKARIRFKLFLAVKKRLPRGLLFLFLCFGNTMADNATNKLLAPQVKLSGKGPVGLSPAHQWV